MSKVLTILVVLIIAIGSYFLIRNTKESYEVLPIDEQNSLSGAGDNFQDWRQFSSTAGKFKVSMPSLPQHVADKIGDPVSKEQRKFDTYAAADDYGTAYVVSTITLPSQLEAKQVEGALRNVVNDMLVRNKENKLKSAEMGDFHGARALNFAFENGDVTVLGKAILHGSTIYILSAVGKNEVFKKEHFDFFVKTFQIQDVSNK